MTGDLRLGVNIDHVATIRNARGGDHPDPVNAALVAAQSGADGITAHLREDRRHIRDDDLERLMAALTIPLNLEMAATEEMLEIALRHRPHAACIVPERREERFLPLRVFVEDDEVGHDVSTGSVPACRARSRSRRCTWPVRRSTS